MRNLQIKSLDNQHPEELPNFFDSLDYSHAPHWSGCYCRFYHVDCSIEDWMKRDPKINREETIHSIKNGEMNGFLVYDEDKAVGWLNAQKLNTYKRLIPDLSEYVDQNYIVTICFVIHPDYRNQGIATFLLAHAIEYYKQLGFDGMLALPPTEIHDIQKTYRGTLQMYLKKGYEKVTELDGITLVKLNFKQQG